MSFLIGAGVSSQAGMPSTGKLTDRIRSGQDVVEVGVGFRIGERPHTENPIYTDPVRPIAGFIRALAELSDLFYGRLASGRMTNYEDLHYLTEQIEDCLSFEYENPALLPLIERLARRFTAGDEAALHQLSGKAAGYIQDIVWDELERHTASCDLGCFQSIVKCVGKIERLDIFTLNHDRLLEQALRAVPFSDGFEKPWGDVMIWTNSYSQSGPRVFKLHGSTDWLRLRVDDRPGGRQVVARALTSDIYHLKGPKGEDLGFPLDARPQFLAGTFNKILAYESATYTDQHSRFRESLGTMDRVIVCGYSFGDKAINSRLIHWLHRLPSNRMIIIHPRPEALRASARGAIGGHWDRWVAAGQLVVLRNGIEEVDWPSIEATL